MNPHKGLTLKPFGVTLVGKMCFHFKSHMSVPNEKVYINQLILQIFLYQETPNQTQKLTQKN